MMQPMAKRLLRLHGLRCELSEAIREAPQPDAKGSQPALGWGKARRKQAVSRRRLSGAMRSVVASETSPTAVSAA